MAKKSTLAAAFRQREDRTEPHTEPVDVQTGTRASQPPSRQGTKTIAGHFDPAVSRQLREIALAEDSSVQALLREALNDLFAKRGRPTIA